MSFGIGIGDILKVSELAYQLWKACTEASTEFSELSGHLNTLHRLLKVLVQEVGHPLSLLNRRGGHRRDEFTQILENLEASLLELEQIVTKYRRIGQGRWKVLKYFGFVGFAMQELGPLREKLVLHLTVITTFYDTVQSGSLARIESHVEDIKKAIVVDEEKTMTSSVEQRLRDAKLMPEGAATKVIGWVDDSCDGIPPRYEPTRLLNIVDQNFD